MKLLPPLLLLLTSGCSYLSQRGDDFADCWKGEVQFTIGGVWAQAGPVAHEGLGFQEAGMLGSTRAGWRYGYDLPAGSSHGETPYQIYSVLTHSSSSSNSPNGPVHRCFVLLPTLFCGEGIHENVLHDFDIEAGGGLLLGLTFGFSPGEFLDFLLGWIGVDIAGDDGPDLRKARNREESHYRARAGLGPVLPHKNPAGIPDTPAPSPPEKR